jgi:hypothetical protein
LEKIFGKTEAIHLSVSSAMFPLNRNYEIC